MSAPTTIPDFRLIRQLAGWAATAYGQSTVCDPHTDAEALVTLDGDKIVVAFRGSSSIKDWMVDARFLMTDLIKDWYLPPAKVHRGFLDQFEAINAEVVKQVRNLTALAPTAKLYITGHSLGGALAILCALEFSRQNIPIAGVITFGQPRVGNKTFANIYNATLKDITWAIVAAGDPVPLLPPLLNGYRDCGTEVFIRNDGDIRLDPFIGWELATDLLGAFLSWRCGRLGLIPNHLMNHYKQRLSAAEIITQSPA